MIRRAQEETNLKVFEAGRKAGEYGNADNPFPVNSPYHPIWRPGYEFGANGTQEKAVYAILNRRNRYA